MINITKLLLAGAVAFALVGVGQAQNAPPAQPSFGYAADGPTFGQAPAVGPPAQGPPAQGLPADPSSGVPAAGDQQGILQALPQPPALPASLFAPSPPPSTGFMGPNLPYFVPDRLLDNPVRPPGWFAGAEVDVLKLHLNPQVIVQDPAGRAAGTFFQAGVPAPR